jgi:hypothetical protein
VKKVFGREGFYSFAWNLQLSALKMSTVAAATATEKQKWVSNKNISEIGKKIP